jgi:hypothetical protein
MSSAAKCLDGLLHSIAPEFFTNFAKLMFSFFPELMLCSSIPVWNQPRLSDMGNDQTQSLKPIFSTRVEAAEPYGMI